MLIRQRSSYFLFWNINIRRDRGLKVFLLNQTRPESSDDGVVARSSKDIETSRGRGFRTELRPEKTVGSARDKLLCFLARWLGLRAWEWRISLIDDVAAVYWSRR